MRIGAGEGLPPSARDQGICGKLGGPTCNYFLPTYVVKFVRKIFGGLIP